MDLKTISDPLLMNFESTLFFVEQQLTLVSVSRHRVLTVVFSTLCHEASSAVGRAMMRVPKREG